MSSSITADPPVLLITPGQDVGTVAIRYRNAFYPEPGHLWVRRVGAPVPFWSQIDPTALDDFQPDPHGPNEGGRFTWQVVVGEPAHHQ
jgi:hypothetical protein